MMAQSEAPHVLLDAAARGVKAATNLDGLCAALSIMHTLCLHNIANSDLDVGPAECDFETACMIRGIHTDDLPNFGGLEPGDTTGIWSWDETRLMVDAQNGGFELQPRRPINWVGAFKAPQRKEPRGMDRRASDRRKESVSAKSHAQVLLALRALEDACNKLAGLRTHAQYLAMIDSGQQTALIELDDARRQARELLQSKGIV